MTSRDSWLLAAGSAANGLLAYAFFVLASRTLGVADTAPVSVLWSYWAMSGAVLTFPVQHWIIRRFAADGHEATVARSLPRLCAVVGIVAVATGALAYAFREPLFHTSAASFPAIVVGITVGSFGLGVVRGVLAGRGRYGATAVSFAAENLLRVAAAGAVILFGGGAEAFGAALLLGPLVGLAWTRSLRFGHAPEGVPVVRESLGLVSGVAGGTLAGQLVLSGPPVVLALMSAAPAAVSSMFLALAVWRAPYIVALGMTPQLTTALTHLVVAGSPRRLTRALAVTALVATLAAGVAALGGVTVLEPFLRLAFGSGVGLEPWGLAGLGVGTVYALGNLVLVLMMLALGRSRAATSSWLLALTAAAAWVMAAETAPTATVVTAFLIAEVGAFVLLGAAVRWEIARVARVARVAKAPGAGDRAIDSAEP